MSFMSIQEVADTVPVKNRYTDASVSIVHDRQELTWKPQEIKYLPKVYAQFFINKSTRKRDLKGKAKVQTLVIPNTGKPEDALSIAMFAGPQQLVDKPWYDKDGTPLKERYVDVNETGVEAIASKVERNESASRDERASAVREQIADKVADNVAAAAEALAEGEGDAKGAE